MLNPNITTLLVALVAGVGGEVRRRLTELDRDTASGVRYYLTMMQIESPFSANAYRDCSCTRAGDAGFSRTGPGPSARSTLLRKLRAAATVIGWIPCGRSAQNRPDPV